VTRKQTRKQRAAAVARIAAGLTPSQIPIKRDFLADDRGRFAAYVWMVSLTFGYGVLNTLLLGRPERRVNQEALAVCISVLFIRLFLFYTRPVRVKVYGWATESLWAAIQNFGRRKHIRIASVLVPAILLAATAILEPAIAARRLLKSDAGLVPGIDSGLEGTDPAYRFRETSARIEKRVNERTPGDPNTLKDVRDALANILQNERLPESVSVAAKLELASLQSYESLSRIGAADPRILHRISSGYAPEIPAVIGAGMDKTEFIMTPEATNFTFTDPSPKFFSDFGVLSFGHNPGSPIPQFAITKGDDTAVVFNNIKVQGLAQDIGNLTWTNVVFQGCLIRYHGQPIRMGNVRFFGCTFERSWDGAGQRLLDYLSKHQGESVSAYAPSVSK
jgi:hypothetical protein